MNRTLLRVQALYGEMGRSEKKVADYLLTDDVDILPLSIRELADASDSSEATIVRFSRRLGFAGFGDLKFALAADREKEVITPYIVPTDGSYEIFEKLCNDAYLSLERTKNTLSGEGMEAATQAINRARKVVLIGLGSSASVAGDAANQLLRAGCNSAAYSDTHMQMVAVANLTAEDVLIGVSHSGSSKDIVDAMRIAKGNGVFTVAITSRERSPVARQSNIVLLTDTDEVRHFSQGFSSHLSRRVVLDALVYSIVQKREESMKQSLENAEVSLLTKRIPETEKI